MADFDTARPVPGEIMAGLMAANVDRAQSDVADIIEAEFEVVPAKAPSSRRQTFSVGPSDGLDVLAAHGREPATAFRRRGGLVFWSAGLVMVATAFWVSGGHAVLGLLEPSTNLHAQSAFTLSDISSRVDQSGARPVLFVDGQAANDGAARSAMPGLEIRVAGLDGTVTRYKLGTSARNLDPGEQFAFSSRLEVPRNGVKSVSVTFAE